MHGAAGADQQRLVRGPVAQGPQRGADGDVEVWVVPVLRREDGRGRTAVGEHADEQEVGVVDPVEGGVGLGGDAGGGEVGLEGGDHGEVRVEAVVFVFGWVDVGDGAFPWVWIGGDEDAVECCCPVGALKQVREVSRQCDHSSASQMFVWKCSSSVHE